MPRSTLNGTLTVFCDSGSDDRLVHDLARRFFGAGKRAAEHRAVAAEEQRFGERAVPLDAAVGDDRHARPVDREAAFDQRLHLRHAEAGRDARRAAAAGPDADLDAVGAALDQEARALGGGDVAGDDLDVGETPRGTRAWPGPSPPNVRARCR